MYDFPMENGHTIRIVHRSLDSTIGYLVYKGGKLYGTIVTVGNEDAARWFEVPNVEAGQLMITNMLENLAVQMYNNMNGSYQPPQPSPSPPQPSPEPQLTPDQAKKLQKQQAKQQRRENRAAIARLNREAQDRRRFEQEQRRRQNAKLRKKAILLPCPSCVAGKNESCVSPAGNRLPEPHISRIEQVQRHWAYLS